MPTSPDQTIRFIDARDLAEFAITALEQNLSGIYNTLGNIITWQEWIAACRAASGGNVTLHWVKDEKFLQENAPSPARPFSAFPMVSPVYKAFNAIDSHKALAAGLRYRPAAETARDILAWHQTRRMPEAETTAAPEKSIRGAFDWGQTPENETPWMAGLTADQEATLLRRWKQNTTVGR